MEQSHEFILHMLKDLRKGCHESCHQFVQWNGIEDETSIGCRLNVKTMYYNPKFDFEEGIQEHTNNVTFILDLFNADAGFENYNPAKRFLCFFL